MRVASRVKKVPYENIDHIRSPDPRSKLSICVIRLHDGREFVGVSELGQNEARVEAVKASRKRAA